MAPPSADGMTGCRLLSGEMRQIWEECVWMTLNRGGKVDSLTATSCSMVR